MADSRWHNVTVKRIGNEATLVVTSGDGKVVGSVSGRKGTHRLLDTSGVVYVGANLHVADGKIKVVNNFEGTDSGPNSILFFLKLRYLKRGTNWSAKLQNVLILM